MAEEKNQLAKIEGLAPSKYDDGVFKDLSKSADFLARIQLMTANSGPVSDGEFPVNHYAIVDSGELIDLGKEVDVAVLAWRPKTLDTNENVASFDPESDLFQTIKKEAKIKNSGCMYGLEFLLYVGSKKQFVTFFMGSKSARRSANKLKQFIHSFATLKAIKVDNKKYQWFTPSIHKCSTPVPLPDIEEVKKEVEKFNNPEDSNVDAGESSDDSEERAR